MRFYVTVTEPMKRWMEEFGLNSEGYPEVYSSKELAMRFRCPADTEMLELELDEDAVSFYTSGVYLVTKKIEPSTVVGYQKILL